MLNGERKVAGAVSVPKRQRSMLAEEVKPAPDTKTGVWPPLRPLAGEMVASTISGCTQKKPPPPPSSPLATAELDPAGSIALGLTSRPFSDKNSGIGREKVPPITAAPVYDAGLKQETAPGAATRAATGKMVPKRHETAPAPKA